MSSSVLAKKRRANGVTEKPVNNQPPADTAAKKTSMTLPQVLGVIDARLKKLEGADGETSVKTAQPSPELIQEYEARFQMLATEINEMKDIVLKLQSFTMEVNKTLLNERLEIMNNASNALDVEDINVDEVDLENVEFEASDNVEKSTFDTLMETIKDEEVIDSQRVHFS